MPHVSRSSAPRSTSPPAETSSEAPVHPPLSTVDLLAGVVQAAGIMASGRRGTRLAAALEAVSCGLQPGEVPVQVAARARRPGSRDAAVVCATPLRLIVADESGVLGEVRMAAIRSARAAGAGGRSWNLVVRTDDGVALEAEGLRRESAAALVEAIEGARATAASGQVT